MQKKTQEIAERISADYAGKDLLLVGVLKGGFMFLADLARALTIDVSLDFISCSSYGNSTVSSGVVRILKDIDYDITGVHVLLVEDLIDTGLTLNYLKDLFAAKGCASVKVCTIMDKPSRRKVDLLWTTTVSSFRMRLWWGMGWIMRKIPQPARCVRGGRRLT